MSTPFDIFGVVAPAGSKLVAELILPAGKVTLAATTITGGTAGGPNTVPTGATSIYLGMSLTSGMTQIFEGSADIAGTVLPNSTDRPYTVRVWAVDPATVMTTYSNLAAAVTGAATYWSGQSGHTANDAVVYLRDVPRTIQGGTLVGGVWVNVIDPTTVNNIGIMKTGVNLNSVNGQLAAVDGNGRMLVRAVGVGDVNTAELSATASGNFRSFFHNGNVVSAQTIDDVGTGGGGGNGQGADSQVFVSVR